MLPAPPPGPFLRFSLCPPGHEYAGKKRRECNTFLGPDELSGPGASRSRKRRKAKGRIENKEVRSQEFTAETRRRGEKDTCGMRSMGNTRMALRRPGLSDFSPVVSPDVFGPVTGRPPMI